MSSLTEARYSDSRRVQFDWTAQRVSDLRRMWVDEEMTSNAIAVELGVTRNMVIGKIGRLGLQGRQCDANNRSKSATHREERIRIRAPQLPRAPTHRPDGWRRSSKGQPVAPSLPIDLDAPSPHGCALLELTAETCHWPIGEVGKPGFHFCGGKVSAGPYCAGHHGIAYRRAG